MKYATLCESVNDLSSLAEESWVLNRACSHDVLAVLLVLPGSTNAAKGKTLFL